MTRVEQLCRQARERVDAGWSLEAAVADALNQALSDVNNGRGILSRIPYNEPLFVLRARDRVAPATVRDWAQRARNLGAPAEKVAGAMDAALAMEAWARLNGSKTPD